MGKLWFCLGLTPSGKIRLVSFASGKGEALGKALNFLRPWEKPVQGEASAKAEASFNILYNVFMGKPAGKLPPLAWEVLPSFSRKVLRLTCRIPRGFVASYGALAGVLGVPQGGRAVGAVMAANPFPLLVPCHRVVCSDGRLGGYSLGVKFKEELLRREGVKMVRVRGEVKAEKSCFLSWERLKGD